MSNENDSKTDAEYVVHLREASRKHLKVGLTFMLVLAITTAGIAAVVAGAFSMAGGEYVSAVGLFVGALSMFLWALAALVADQITLMGEERLGKNDPSDR